MKTRITRGSISIMILGLGGCGAAIDALQTTTPMTVGPDTFSVIGSSETRWLGAGLAGAQRKAMLAGEEKCTSLGKRFLVLSAHSGVSGWDATYELIFRCLAPDDPELKRPTFKPLPNVVIEDRRK